MVQNIFETKQRADELMQKAMEIWRKSDQSDHLEGVEKDPVFSLLMTALAYQGNETESEIEYMKSEVLESFSDSLAPFEVGHAIPATAIVQTALQDGFSEVELTPHHVFSLGDTGAEFISLLNTKVINASVRSVTRMDGRRWAVSLSFKSPVSDLSGFTFAIRNHNYGDLRVTVKGQPLPLVSPWDYSELPLSPCFALDTILYNKSHTYMASSLCLDLFARQNVRMYSVKRHQPKRFLPREADSLELVFEFMGVGDGFVFDKDNLVLNTVLLVNAQQQTATLSSATPIVRVAGYNHQEKGPTGTASQFLHLLRPSEEQMFGNMQVEVRRMSADRFNQGSLSKLLNVLIGKYYTDYYAYMNLGDATGDKAIYNLAQTLSRMADAAKSQNAGSTPGIYLMLKRGDRLEARDESMEVSYVTTSGATINALLTENSRFAPPTGFDAGNTIQIAPPVPGYDEIKDEQTIASLTRYYLATNDRLVTPADIKLFCYHELLARYGIVRDMVRTLTVSRRQQFDNQQCGYEILVEIELVGNSFVKRGFANKVQTAELLLRSMISVRSTNIYPVRVSIMIGEMRNE